MAKRPADMGGDPRIPALQLLLADATPTEKRTLISLAFRDDVVVVNGSFRSIEQIMATLDRETDWVARQLDGSSPIGRSGQENILEKILQIRTHLRHIKHVLF